MYYRKGREFCKWYRVFLMESKSEFRMFYAKFRRVAELTAVNTRGIQPHLDSLVVHWPSHDRGRHIYRLDFSS